MKQLHPRWHHLGIILFVIITLLVAGSFHLPTMGVEASRVFLIVKGVFAATGVVILMFHMMRESPYMKNLDQRLRYLLLLAYGTLSAYATIEQVEADTIVDVRHYGGMVLAISLVLVSIYSIREMKRYRENL